MKNKPKIICFLVVILIISIGLILTFDLLKKDEIKMVFKLNSEIFENKNYIELMGMKLEEYAEPVELFAYKAGSPLCEHFCNESGYAQMSIKSLDPEKVKKYCEFENEKKIKSLFDLNYKLKLYLCEGYDSYYGVILG